MARLSLWLLLLDTFVATRDSHRVMDARGLSQLGLKRLLVALVVCLGCCGSCVVFAQAGGADESEYRRLVEAALEEYGAQRFEESRALFLSAHALSPNARTHRGLGFVAFELREYPDCIEHIEAALASQIKPLTGELRSQAESILARALAFVDRLKVEASPSSVEVTVNGLPRAELPLSAGQPILAIGEHSIEFRAEGYRSEQRKLVVRGGEQRVVRVSLERVPVRSATDQQPRASGWYKSPWLWTAVGVVVVGAGTGTAIALTRGDGKPYAGTSNQTLTGP